MWADDFTLEVVSKDVRTAQQSVQPSRRTSPLERYITTGRRTWTFKASRTRNLKNEFRTSAEPAVAANGAGIVAFCGITSLQAAPAAELDQGAFCSVYLARDFLEQELGFCWKELFLQEN